MQLSCIVIDDQPEAVELIELYIKDTILLNLKLATTNPIEAVQFTRDNPVDLIFLDINMPKLSGIQLSSMIPKTTRIIFTTAYSEYALEGYEHNSIDYLLKPISYERFLKAVYKAQQSFPDVSAQSLTSAAASMDQFIMVKADEKGKLIKVNINNITYVEGLKNYLSIYTSTGQRIVTMLSMKDLEEKLPVPHFIRVHRSYLVAVDKILEIKNGEIIVQNGRIPLGVTYRDDFFKLIDASIINKSSPKKNE